MDSKEKELVEKYATKIAIYEMDLNVINETVEECIKILSEDSQNSLEDFVLDKLRKLKKAVLCNYGEK